MKKLLSLVLALALILGLGVFGIMPASAEENLCDIFHEIAIYVTFNSRPFSVGAVVTRVYSTFYPGMWDEIHVSKAEFYEQVEKLFDKTFDEIIAEDGRGTFDGDDYHLDWFIDIVGDECTIYPGGGVGSDITYDVRGYIPEGNDAYTVYCQRRTGHFGSLERLKEEYDLTDEYLEENLTIDEEFVYPEYPYQVWMPGYKKIVVVYDGEYVKLISAEDVDAIPALSDMITPGDVLGGDVVESPSTGGDDFPTGDVDGDGAISSTDARLTLQMVVGKIQAGDLVNADGLDVDGDGSITTTDARLILQYSVGKITKFPKDA